MFNDFPYFLYYISFPIFYIFYISTTCAGTGAIRPPVPARVLSGTGLQHPRILRARLGPRRWTRCADARLTEANSNGIQTS